MGWIRPSVLWLALLMTTPAMYRFAMNQLDVTHLLARFLIAVPVAAVLAAGLRMVTAGYGRRDEPEPAVPVTPEPLPTDPADRPS